MCFENIKCLILRQQKDNPKAISKCIIDHEITLIVVSSFEYVTWLNYNKQNLHDSFAWKTALCADKFMFISLVKQFAVLNRTDLIIYNVYKSIETSFYLYSNSDVFKHLLHSHYSWLAAI